MVGSGKVVSCGNQSLGMGAGRSTVVGQATRELPQMAPRAHRGGHDEEEKRMAMARTEPQGGKKWETREDRQLRAFVREMFRSWPRPRAATKNHFLIARDGQVKRVIGRRLG